ncbi:hypothetical protein PENSTE_c001G04079 [Penicillium steckii]|uniref:Secreted protein n=1 Tax=Penicillium steckii TaxID=303698 RepID=A0A1V6TZU6_9EURO|nr:hypothetical protein PENSTE_c001G04079 [Penicillium steckii]
MRVPLNMSIFYLLFAGLVAASDKNGCYNSADPHQGLSRNICRCPNGLCYINVDGFCDELRESEEVACIM